MSVGLAMTVQREMLEASMTSTGIIVRKGEYVTGPGGAGSYGPSTTIAFSCRLESIGAGDETEIAREPGIVEVLRLMYPLAVSILGTDVVQVDGKDHEVVAIRPNGTRNVQRVAVLRRRAP